MKRRSPMHARATSRMSSGAAEPRDGALLVPNGRHAWLDMARSLLPFVTTNCLNPPASPHCGPSLGKAGNVALHSVLRRSLPFATHPRSRLLHFWSSDCMLVRVFREALSRCGGRSALAMLGTTASQFAMRRSSPEAGRPILSCKCTQRRNQYRLAAVSRCLTGCCLTSLVSLPRASLLVCVSS